MPIDFSWLTDRIAVGGAIWDEERMIEAVRLGFTHIIDMQREFDDTPLAEPYGVEVLWNPVDDDFQHKPASVFARGVEFAQAALAQPDTRLYIHCQAGVHRAPMMALAVLRASGHTLRDAADLIVQRRPVADLAQVYVRSVEDFMKQHGSAVKEN